MTLPRIDVTVEHVSAVAVKAWAALRAFNDVCEAPRFVRVGNMACQRGETGLEAFTRATLAYSLARSAEFFKQLKSGEKVVRPPHWLINDMLAEPNPALPEEQQ